MPYNPSLLDGVVIFNEVITAGSFTKAADNTGHSTSYISKEINKLEARLGVRLMNRTTRSLSLTPEGELYFQQSQQLISDAEQLQRTLDGHQQNPSGLLKISCLSSLDTHFIQSVFSDFLDLYPDIRLELDISNRKVDMIAEGFDLVVRGTPSLEDSSLISKRLLSARGAVVAAPKYLKAKGIPEVPEDLKHHDCITFSYLKQPRHWPFKNQYGKETVVEVRSKIHSNSSEMELALCVAGQGIVRLPSFMLRDELDTGALVELFPDYQHLAIDIYLVYPSRKHVSAKVRAFIDFISERFDHHYP